MWREGEKCTKTEYEEPTHYTVAVVISEVHYDLVQFQLNVIIFVAKMDI